MGYPHWRSRSLKSGVRSLLVPLIVSLAAVPVHAQGGGEGFPAEPGAIYQGPSTEFQAPDQSFRCRVPQGWTVNVVPNPHQTALRLLPEAGSDREMQVYWTIAPGATIEKLAELEIGSWQNMGAQLLASPRFGQVAGAPAVEMALAGRLANGTELRLWAGRILKGEFLFLVNAFSLVQAAPETERHARFLFRSMEPGEIGENTELATAILGRWSRLEKKSMDNWVLHQYLFEPGGRYQFLGISDFLGNSEEHRERGTYQVYGSLLLVVPEQGASGVYFLEAMPPGNLRIGTQVFHRE
jgi:hypothetical protein